VVIAIYVTFSCSQSQSVRKELIIIILVIISSSSIIVISTIIDIVATIITTVINIIKILSGWRSPGSAQFIFGKRGACTFAAEIYSRLLHINLSTLAPSPALHSTYQTSTGSTYRTPRAAPPACP